MEILVKRKMIVWVNDYYEVDEINNDTIQRCIEDDYQLFNYSEPDWANVDELETRVYDEDDNLLKVIPDDN